MESGAYDCRQPGGPAAAPSPDGRRAPGMGTGHGRNVGRSLPSVPAGYRGEPRSAGVFRAGHTGKRIGCRAHRLPAGAPGAGPAAGGPARHPLVFGWMQSRHAVPAWFGVGHALQQFAKGGPGHGKLLRRMMREFPLFSDLVRNVELGMAKADLDIARLYSGLVRNAALRKQVFTLLEKEFL